MGRNWEELQESKPYSELFVWYKNVFSIKDKRKKAWRYKLEYTYKGLKDAEMLWTVSRDQSFGHSFFDCSDWNNHTETVYICGLFLPGHLHSHYFPRFFCAGYFLSVALPFLVYSLPMLLGKFHRWMHRTE